MVADTKQLEAMMRQAQNQIYGSQNDSGMQPASPADQLAAKQKQLMAKAKVLSFIEAQLRLNLFADDMLADKIFQSAMEAATKAVAP